MKITQITIKNFLKLKDINFNPSHTNVIVGRNKMGKTSILKAIQTAFTGNADSSMIRIGEGKAEITIELDDLMIKRSITEKGNYLDISNKEGFKMPAPQRYLDGVLGTFSFNPIAFFDKKAIDRKKYLLNAIKLKITPEELKAYIGDSVGGIDYDAHALEVIETVRKFYYDKRTIANAEQSKKEKSLLDLTSSIPEGFDPSQVSEEAIEKLRGAIQTDEMNKQKHEDNQKYLVSLQKNETDVVAQITALQEKLKSIQTEIVEVSQRKFDFSDDMALASAKDALKALEDKRSIVFTVKRAEEVRGELTTAMNEAKRLDDIVTKLTKEVPADLIAKAKLPIEGLTISGDDILINGVNIDNMSSSEQLKFGLQIVKALNGDFKVICVDGIESLDKESFEFFLKEIEGDEFQYFVTRVEGNPEHSITIEDGEIKA